MEYNEYLSIIKNKFDKSEYINAINAEMFYEEKFQIKWIATKLKQFAFISYVDRITLETLREYSQNCTKYALKNYKGLIRGMQNGVVAYNIIVSNNIDQEAIDFVSKRPKKHFAAFEIPIIYDLQNRRTYFYKDTPIWGFIYYKHIRNYIEQNFISSEE